MSVIEIPIFLIEDQPLLLKTLLRLLSTRPHLRVVGTAMSAEQALELLPKSGARVALVDIELPNMNGIELVDQLKRANVACELLMFTTFVDQEKVFQAMRVGAAGYLVKGASIERISQAIETVDCGGTVIEPVLAKTFWKYFKGMQSPQPPVCPLNQEQLDLLELIAKGLSNGEAATVMNISVRNVRTRLIKLYDVMGVRSHVELVVEALKKGWIQSP